MVIDPVGTTSLVPAGGEGLSAVQTPSSPIPFSALIDHLVADANTQQVQVDQAVRELAAGNTDNLHNVMLTVAKADLSFRMLLEIRNRLTDAYQEIMRMQV